MPDLRSLKNAVEAQKAAAEILTHEPIRLATRQPQLRRQEWRPWKKLGFRVLEAFDAVDADFWFELLEDHASRVLLQRMKALLI